MPWTCSTVVAIRRVGVPTVASETARVTKLLYRIKGGREVELRDLPVGSVFHTNMIPLLADGHALYKDEPSLIVVLPGGIHWHANRPGADGTLWTVTGPRKRLTASPSIHYYGRYHGTLVDGVISDDIGGRVYDRFGARHSV